MSKTKTHDRRDVVVGDRVRVEYDSCKTGSPSNLTGKVSHVDRHTDTPPMLHIEAEDRKGHISITPAGTVRSNTTKRNMVLGYFREVVILR